MRTQVLKRTKVEIANTLTHALGAILAIPCAWLLVNKGFEINVITGYSMLIFTLGIFVLYASSAAYHWASNPQIKYVLRRFDHASIYVLISASYTPIWLSVVGGTLGITICITLWTLSVVGIAYEIVALGKYPKLSLAIYLVMGWSIVFAARPVWNELSSIELWCILVEGLSYTIGTYFYMRKDRPWFHVIWHLFVLGGTVSHYLCMLFYAQRLSA